MDATSPKTTSIPLRACVDAAPGFHEIPQRLIQILELCRVPQRPRPLAPRPVVDLVWVGRAKDHSGKRFRTLALPCLALPCLALPCLALPCLALPCLALPCLALPCLALPCLALPCLALPLPLPCLALPCPCRACAPPGPAVLSSLPLGTLAARPACPLRLTPRTRIVT